jgi:uncharacterized protein YfaQ (DUF2300 family)
MTLLSRIISVSEMDTDVQDAEEYVVLAKNGSGDWTALISGEGVTKASATTKKMQTPIVLAAMNCLAVIHTSLKNRDIRETKEIVKDAAAIVDSYKSDPTIPTINGVPEGFDK